MGRGYEPLSTEDWNKLMRANVIARPLAVPGSGSGQQGEPTPPVSPSPTPSNTPSPTPTPTPTPLPPINYSFITSSSNRNDLTTYNFTPPELTAGLYAIVFHSRGTTNSRVVSSMTFGGESVNLVGNQRINFVTTTIGYVRLSTSGIKTLTITNNGTCSSAGYGLWKIENNISDTPIQTQKLGSTTTGTKSLTFTGLTSDNVGILGSSKQLYTNASSWTNATKRYDTDTDPGFTGGFRMSGADFLTTTSGDRVVSINGSSSGLALIGVIWN